MLNHYHHHHRHFLLGTSLEPAVISIAQASSFRLQYFCIMCDVSTKATFCSESVECFCGVAFGFLDIFYCCGGPSYYRYNNTFCVPCCISVHKYLLLLLLLFLCFVFVVVLVVVLFFTRCLTSFVESFGLLNDIFPFHSVLNTSF
jgi:hypothetical protein